MQRRERKDRHGLLNVWDRAYTIKQSFQCKRRGQLRFQQHTPLSGYPVTLLHDGIRVTQAQKRLSGFVTGGPGGTHPDERGEGQTQGRPVNECLVSTDDALLLQTFDSLMNGVTG